MRDRYNVHITYYHKVTDYKFNANIGQQFVVFFEKNNLEYIYFCHRRVSLKNDKQYRVSK